MFSKLLPLALAFAAFSVFPSAFAEGGKDGGGGDTRNSTTAEVVAAIHHVVDEPGNYIGDEAKDNIYAAFFELQYVSALSHIRDRAMLAVLSKMMLIGSDAGKDGFPATAIYRDLKATQFDIRLEKNCPADGARKETHGYTEHRLGAPICLGVPLLTRIPKDSLRFQIRALVAHELAHHFGYDEDAANRFQNVFLVNNVGTIDPDFAALSLEASINRLETVVQHQMKEVEKSGSITGVACWQFGRMDILADEINSSVRSGMAENRRNENEPTIFAPYLASTEDIIKEAGQLSTYCFHQNTTPIDQLIEQLNRLDAAIRVLAKARKILF
jgi:hypothetical protein